MSFSRVLSVILTGERSFQFQLRQNNSANPIEENGIEYMRRASGVLSRSVGDGTKTAMLLTHDLVKEGASALDQGYSLKDVLSGMEKAVTAVRSSIVSASVHCDEQSLLGIALTASGDLEISNLVIEAMKRTGKYGVTVLNADLGGQTSLTVQEGLRFDRGFLSDKFVSNAETGECEMKDCKILIHDRKISSMRDIIPLLEQVAADGRPLLVIAEDIEGEALSIMLVNHLGGKLKCVAVRAPGIGDRRKAILQDIAVLTGAKLVEADLGVRLDTIRLEDLGGADRVVVSSSETIIWGGHGLESAVEAHVANVRAAVERASDSFDRAKLHERLASLAGAIALICVGGTTDVDVEERKYRASSAIHSTSAAIEEGWSYGGGVAFLRAKEAITSLAYSGEGERLGASAVVRALDAPFSAIAKTCQKSPIALLGELHSLTSFGLNADTATVQDFAASQILDPTKTLRIALDAAFSYAREVLRTDSWSASTVAPNGPQ